MHLQPRHQVLATVSGTPTNVVTPYGTLPFYHQHYVSSIGGAVYAENLNYLFPAPCPMSGGTPCNDLLFTPIVWSANVAFMGPPSSLGNNGYLDNTAFNKDTTSGTVPITITLPNVYKAGDDLVMGAQATGTYAIGAISDTCLNTWTTISGSGFDYWYATNIVPCATPDVITVAVTGAGNWMALGGEVIGGGVLDASTVSSSTSCSGSGPYTATMTAITTTHADILVALTMTAGGVGGGYQTYNPGTGFLAPAPGQIAYYAGGVGYSASAFAEWGPAGIGTQNATYSYNPISGGSPSCSDAGITFAFKPSLTNPAGDPIPRLIRYLDLEASGDFPDINGKSGYVFSTDGYKVTLVNGAGSGNISTTGLTTNKIPKALTAFTLGDSSLADDGTTVSTTEAVDFSGAASFKPNGGGGTFTIGSANQNWATLGTGIVKNTTTTGALSNAAYTDVVALWASGSCSGFLKSDGTCPSGTFATVALDNLSGVAINTSLLPASAASSNLGTNLLPWGNLYLGAVTNQSLSFVTSGLTANRTITFPDANSNPVQGIANPSDTNVINYVDTAGVQHRIAQSGGGGTTNPAAQYLLPFYSAGGTASTLSGATGITTDSSQNNLTLVGGVTTPGSGGSAAGSTTGLQAARTLRPPTALASSLRQRSHRIWLVCACGREWIGWRAASGAASSHVQP